MQRSLRPFFLSLLAASALLVTACGDDEESLPFDTRDCSLNEKGARVTGNWEITANLDRESCTVEYRDGNVRIYNDEPWSVSQAEIGGSNNENSLTFTIPNVPLSQFQASSGRVRGACVDFETHETVSLPEGTTGQVHLEWEGLVTAPGVIEGIVRGDGPETCNLRGTFVINVSGAR